MAGIQKYKNSAYHCNSDRHCVRLVICYTSGIAVGSVDTRKDEGVVVRAITFGDFNSVLALTIA